MAIEPNWAKYDLSDVSTNKLKTYHSSPSLGGGSLISSDLKGILGSDSAENLEQSIGLPLRDLI